MAYSILHSVLNDCDVPEKRRSDAALKRYESALDSRAWTNDKFEKSVFIQDVIKRKGTNHQLPCKLSEAVKSLNLVPKNDLVESIKCLCAELKV